ncbi:MAG: lysophospholipid acyltransferase family protein [Planctomycetota bacterium]
MKYIVSIIAYVLGALTLVIGLPLVTLCFYFLGSQGVCRLASFMMRLLTASFLVRVKLEGVETVDRSKPHLYMSNHASFFDFLILAGYLPCNKRGLEAAEHFSWPIWGAFLRKSGMIPIDRSSPRASLKSILHAADHLKEGISILILPEGTRTRDGKMLPFKKLPFKLAKKGGSDIIPVGLIGTFNIKKKTSWVLNPGKVIMRFGDPIPAETVESMEIEALKDLTKERIRLLIGEE